MFNKNSKAIEMQTKEKTTIKLKSDSLRSVYVFPGAICTFAVFL